MQAENEVKKEISEAMNDNPLWDAFIDVCSPDLKCRITHEPFEHPVILDGDGETYEEYAIKEWLAKNNTSPAYNTPLTQEGRKLTPNKLAPRLVAEAFEKFKAKEGKTEAKKLEKQKMKKSNNAEESVTSDSDLIAFVNTFKQMSKAFPNNEFKAQILDNNFISQILFEKRQVFMLLQLVNKEWKEKYQFSDDLVEAANKLLVSFIKDHFAVAYINTEISGYLDPDLMKSYPKFCKVLNDLLPKPSVEEKKPMDLPIEKAKKNDNAPRYYPEPPKISAKNPNAFFSANASQKGNNQKSLRSSLDENNKPISLPSPSKNKSNQKSLTQTNLPALQKAIKENNQKFLGASLEEDKKSSALLPLESRSEECDYSFNVKLYGDSGVGKSSLLIRWVNGTYTDSYISTIGIDFKIRKMNIDHKIVKMQVWDTAGQERFRTQDGRSQGERGEHGVIFMFDLTDRLSFDNLKSWLQKYEDDKSDAIKVLVATKGDLFYKCVVDISEAEEFAKANNMAGPVVTSSKVGVGVQLAFELTARCVMQRRTQNNKPEPESKPKSKHEPLKPPRENSGSSCLVM